MTSRTISLAIVCLGLALVGTGCNNPPGKPGREPEDERPEQVASFAQLFRQNCAGCHGVEGKGGASIALANPAYLAMAGVANIQSIMRDGVPGTMMPAFGKEAGGMLTDRQIAILAEGMLATWGRPDSSAGVTIDPTAPTYRGSSPGDPVQGRKSFAMFCARCHGSDAAGIPSRKLTHSVSIVDSSYLALVSDQGLRSTVIVGRPEQGMPDWRSDMTGPDPRAMTEKEVTDTVAWLASHRVTTPGQPYTRNQ